MVNSIFLINYLRVYQLAATSSSFVELPSMNGTDMTQMAAGSGGGNGTGGGSTTEKSSISNGDKLECLDGAVMVTIVFVILGVWVDIVQ